MSDSITESFHDLASRIAASSAPAEFAGKVSNWKLSVPSRESHIRPLLERLEADDDRLAVWRDVLATTKGAKIKASDVDNAISRDKLRAADEVWRGRLADRCRRGHPRGVGEGPLPGELAPPAPPARAAPAGPPRAQGEGGGCKN